VYFRKVDKMPIPKPFNPLDPDIPPERPDWNEYDDPDEE